MSRAFSITAIFTLAFSCGFAVSSRTPAHAVSLKVKIACASDYYAHCSNHAPGSPGVRSCMRAHGPLLSKRCVKALVGAGEVSANYVAERRAARKTAAR